MQKQTLETVLVFSEFDVRSVSKKKQQHCTAKLFMATI